MQDLTWQVTVHPYRASHRVSSLYRPPVCTHRLADPFASTLYENSCYIRSWDEWQYFQVLNKWEASRKLSLFATWSCSTRGRPKAKFPRLSSLGLAFPTLAWDCHTVGIWMLLSSQKGISYSLSFAYKPAWVKSPLHFRDKLVHLRREQILHVHVCVGERGRYFHLSVL